MMTRLTSEMRQSPSFLHLRIRDLFRLAARTQRQQQIPPLRGARHPDPSSSPTTSSFCVRVRSAAAARRRVNIKDTNAAGHETVGNPEPMDQSQDNSMPSAQEQEQAIKKKFGGLMPKKPPLISKDHERAYFDSADWALGKSGQQGVAKPKGPLEALRPKLQPTRQQQQRSRRLINASSENEDGDGADAEDMNIN
ncbi:hypothetical protein ABZP36_015049 [Zizania latifolia]